LAAAAIFLASGIGGLFR